MSIRHLVRRAHLRGDQAFRLSTVGGILHSSALSHGTDTGRLGDTPGEVSWDLGRHKISAETEQITGDVLSREARFESRIQSLHGSEERRCNGERLRRP